MVTYMGAFINVILRYLGKNMESAVFFFFVILIGGFITVAVVAIAYTINATNYCAFRRRLSVVPSLATSFFLLLLELLLLLLLIHFVLVLVLVLGD